MGCQPTLWLCPRILPAGDQDERLGLLEALRPARLASLLRQVFRRPVDPDLFQRRAGEEGQGGRRASWAKMFDGHLVGGGVFNCQANRQRRDR